MPKLTHDDLEEVSSLLGFPAVGGICKGFSGLIMEHLFEESLDELFKILDFIASYKGKFDQLKKDIDEAKKTINRNEKDLALLKIYASFKIMSVYLNPALYRKEFNNQYISQNDLCAIYRMLHSKKCQEDNPDELFILLDKEYPFDRTSLIPYLHDLEILLSQTNAPLPIFIESTIHSIILRYNSLNKKWFYLNLDSFEDEPDVPSYGRELNNEEVAEGLFNAFSPDDSSPHVVFSTVLVATNKTKNKPSEVLIKVFDSKYPIKFEHAFLFDGEHIGLLHLACQNGRLDIVNDLLKNPLIEVNAEMGEDEVTPLHLACQNGHLTIVQALLAHPNLDLTVKRLSDEATALHLACENGHIEIIKALLESKSEPKIDINAKMGDYHATALYIACQNGHFEVVKVLLEEFGSGIAINSKIDDCDLYIACQKGYSKIVQLLLMHPDIDSVTPLHTACEGGDLRVVQSLLEHSSTMINVQKNGLTALSIACQNGHTLVVEALLLKHQSCHTINALGIDNNTSLQLACLSLDTRSKKKIFQMLMDKGADLRSRNDKGETALDLAFANNNQAAIFVLLAHAQKNNFSLVNIMSSQSLAKATNWAKQFNPSIINYILQREVFIPNPLVAMDLNYSVSIGNSFFSKTVNGLQNLVEKTSGTVNTSYTCL